jgi:hypothetical protein
MGPCWVKQDSLATTAHPHPLGLNLGLTPVITNTVQVNT